MSDTVVIEREYSAIDHKAVRSILRDVLLKLHPVATTVYARGSWVDTDSGEVLDFYGESAKVHKIMYGNAEITVRGETRRFRPSLVHGIGPTYLVVTDIPRVLHAS